VPLVAAALLASPSGADPDDACGLRAPGSHLLSARDCSACHAGAGPGPANTGNHPVDVDYAAAHGRNPGGLRAPAEVIRRGVYLPGGRVQCVTCHDGRSPWAAQVALPPGAVASPAVDPRDPSTYEEGGSWRDADGARAPALPPGSPVEPTPLCAACHSLD
jgi:hypothetical protein